MRLQKYFCLLILLFIINFYSGQDGEMGFNKPIASVSSLSSYTNTPVSYSTGIPEITIPIVSLSTNNKSINVDFSLSYHPKNLLSVEKASDVGLGWTLVGSIGVISREIVNGVDERFHDIGNSNYNINEFDDIYYFNIGNQKGKFKLLRDVINNTFQIVKLTPNNLKIEYTRENNNATLIFNTFKITDQNGFIYYFDKYSTSQFDNGSQGIAYKSAFYVSKIIDFKNEELVNFEYESDIYTSQNNLMLSLQTLKLKRIISKDNGSIEFDYGFDANFRNSLNDPFQINSVYLKNMAGKTINKHELNYSYSTFTDPTNYSFNISKRILSSIKKYNSNLDKFEKTDFEYNQYGSNQDYSPIANQYKDYFLYNYCTGNPDRNEIENPKYFPIGSLNKIKLPTGGYVNYNFESNQYYVNKDSAYLLNLTYDNFTDPEIQYLKFAKSGSFDTKKSNTVSFNISGEIGASKLVYIYFIVDQKYLFDPLVDLGGNTPEVGFSVRDADYNSYNTSVICSESTLDASVTKFYLPSGANIMNILFNACNGGKGRYEIYELDIKSPPFKNAISKHGLRIESINYFENFNSSTPSKSEKFIYDKFDDSNSSSGELISESSFAGSSDEYVLYKNVKVLNGNSGGYTKYYFKTPSDFPAYYDGNSFSYWPYFNVTKNGLLEKSEVYDNFNNLKASEISDYTFSELPFARINFIYNGNYRTRTAWVKEYRNTSKVKTQNYQEIIVSSETIKESNNFNVISEKVTNSDGSIKETFYKYPLDKNNTALVNANILGIPLETEIKNNGVTVGKSEVRYDNATNLFPTSILNYNLDDFNQSYKSVIYDIYDSKGNLVQYSTTPDASNNIGMPTTIIWGYNKTLPIAKIEGAKLSDIPQALIDAIVNASNEDANATLATAQTKEDALLVQLESFKNNASLANFLVTAYTYDPLVGVTNVLPVNGIREIYKYDSFNRLEKVYDVNGKILKEYKYNYKQ